MKKCHAKNIFGKMTAYQTWPFCMAFVFLIVAFFIDYYCAGVSYMHACLIVLFYLHMSRDMTKPTK